jgi:AAT family amino acid transporter
MQTSSEERYGTHYLEERQMTPRWPVPLTHLINVVALLAVFYATWWIFQDPRGIFRLYTPYVGYMYTRWWLIILIWMVYIFQFWPMRRAQLDNWHPLSKAAIAVAVSVVIMMIVIHGFFHGLLGNFGIAYFDAERTKDLPRMTQFFAEEYAALAILMFAALASWLAPAWVVGMERAPWQNEKQPVQGITILIVTFFIATILYFVTMHPHMGILYYPWQYFTSIAPPYWEEFAGTVSGNFHISWIMCATVVVWLVETIWERYPFRMIENAWLRRLATFFGILAIAWAFHLFLYFAQELFIGETIRGTRNDNAPDWRWLHVGEMMIFMLLPALYINFYCGNWPKKFSTPVNLFVRTAITFTAGVVLMVLYYNISHLVLGTQRGISQPEQFPMIPTIWLINIMLVHHWYMDNWPAWRKVTTVAAPVAASAVSNAPLAAQPIGSAAG